MRSAVRATTNSSPLRALAMAHRRPWAAASAAATGIGLGLGIGLPVADGRFGVPLMHVIVALILVSLIRSVTAVEDRSRIGVILALAFSVRVGAAAVLYFASLHAGLGGFVSGDDRNYARLAWAIVQWARGDPQPPDVPPGWNGNDYLLGTFVYVQTFLYWIFGPQVLVAEAVNAGCAGAFIVLLHDIVRRAFGARPALLTAVLVAVYPSLILWSAMNLKDALALLFVGLIFWGAIRFQLKPHWALLALVLVAIVPVESLRRYLYNGLAFLAVVAVAIAPGLSLRPRLVWTATALAGAAFLISVGTRAGPGVPTAGLAGLEQTRYAMALGARTSFIDAKVVPAEEGDTFVVVDPIARSAAVTAASWPSAVAPTLAGATPSAVERGPTSSEPPRSTPTAALTSTEPPSPTPTPTPTPRVLVVAPGTRVVLGSPTAEAAPTVAVVVVYPDDIVVVGKPGTTPAPEPQRRELELLHVPSGSVATIAEGKSDALVLTRTLGYIPAGLSHALFAPFPWALQRAVEVAVVPEMIFWYVLLMVTPWSVWRLRARWRHLLPVALYVVGLLGTFSVTEGNYGTLFRHRSMVIPFVIALASPGLLLLWTQVRSRWVHRLGQHPGSAQA